MLHRSRNPHHATVELLMLIVLVGIIRSALATRRWLQEYDTDDYWSDQYDRQP